jgi:vanillate O-demethylase monooxygenase subunit
MWVKNAWYVAAWSHEIAPGSVKAFTIVDQPLALWRKADGEAVVFEDRCCHRFAPLSLGRVEGDDLRCMYHGMKFASDGRCIEIPGQPQIPKSACVRRYPALERGGWLWVWMGDAA